MLTHLALLLSARGLWENEHTHTHTHINTEAIANVHTCKHDLCTLRRTAANAHLSKDKTIPSLINMFLGNNKNNFNVFTDGALWGFYSLRALTPSHRDNATSKPLIPWIEVSMWCVYMACVCVSTLPSGGCGYGYHMKASSTGAASEPMTPSCFTIALMCCLILPSYSFFLPPGSHCSIAGWLWSAAYINSWPHPLTLCKHFIFHHPTMSCNNGLFSR